MVPVVYGWVNWGVRLATALVGWDRGKKELRWDTSDEMRGCGGLGWSESVALLVWDWVKQGLAGLGWDESMALLCWDWWNQKCWSDRMG